MIPNERRTLEEDRKLLENQPVQPLPALNLTNNENLLKRLEAPLALDLSSTNRLFNPVQWVKAADGHLIKNATGDKIGPQAVVVTNITPLFLIITLDDTKVLDSGARYYVGVEREAAPTPAARRKKPYPVSLNEKTDAFALTEVKGPKENPTGLILKLNDTGESVTVTKDRPYKREDGYMADLRYDPDKKAWSNQRVGATLGSIAGDVYTISGINLVATNQYEVVLSARSNGKKTPRPYNREQ
jgi:hypothetical protein